MNYEVVKTKMPYEKPALHIIDLAADEVLGVGCKTSSGENNCSAQIAAGVKDAGS